MHKLRAALIISGIVCAPLLVVCHAQTIAEDKSIKVSYFDVLDLPARIDEPKLARTTSRYALTCAMANRSEEHLLGVQLILLILDRDGKTRTRVNWSEESQVIPASIRNFEFHPPIKDSVPSTDRLFLIIDGVIGRETIWHAIDAEKALRGYARGQHDIVPRVRTAANKDDRERPMRVIPMLRKP